MDKLTFAICGVLFLISVMTSRKRPLSPIVFFYALWTFILFLSVLNLYDIYKPSDEAYLLILLMLLFFYIGSLNSFFTIKKVGLPKTNEISALAQNEPNFRLFYFLTIFAIVFALIDCVIVIKLFLGGVPMWQIRNWGLAAFGAENPMVEGRSFLEEIFRSLMIAPFRALIPPVAAFSFFNPESKNKHRPLLILSLVSLLLSTVAGGGGRLGYINYFGCFLLAFLAFSNKSIFRNFNAKKYKKYVLLVLIFGVFVVVLFTNIRTGAGNFIRQTYTYFALPPTLLSVWLTEIKTVRPLFGLLTFFGLHSYFFRGFQTLHLNFLVPEVYQVTFDQVLNAEVFRNTGYGVGNAFVTPVYYFFIDGGYLFVCIASMFFGICVARFFKRFIVKINIKTFTYYALVMFGVLLSMMRIQTCIPAYWISFLFASILLRPKRPKFKHAPALSAHGNGGNRNE